MSASADNRRLAIWLLVCCALIYAMVVLGGVTRLTRSGLSIVEWDPIMGAIPPLNAEHWQQAFDKYKLTPEFIHVNSDMGVEEFKSIFYFEYFHRLLGRVIGLAFLIPFIYFLIRKQISEAMAPRLALLFVLGGLQGALGWYMVKSGLVNDPHVSPYRLTAHLGLAVLIYAYMLHLAMSLLTIRPSPVPAGTRRYAFGLVALIYIMILSGGFVAGNKAGFAFNTWPLMNGQWIPAGMYALEPWWRNLFENLMTVQFNHRLIAYLLCLAVPGLWWLTRSTWLLPAARTGLALLLAMLAIQVGLGIATLLWVVPVPLAAAHQAGAMALFTLALFTRHSLRASA